MNRTERRLSRKGGWKNWWKSALGMSAEPSGDRKRARRSNLRLEALEARLALTHSITDHIHPYLQIFINGQKVDIPANIGLGSTAEFSPHTHDTTGRLHIGEGLGAGLDAGARYVTLDDFFDVWRQADVGDSSRNNPNAFFSSTQLMDKVADATHKVFMTVNGVPNTQYENYIPEDGDQIVLTYGEQEGPNDALPTLAALPNITLQSGSPQYVSLDGFDGLGEAITYTVTSSNPAVTTSVATGNPSLRMTVEGFGTMVFQLLQDKAPRPVERVVTLANTGFYDGLQFHRVINDFVIQGGDPNGNGTGGSQLGNFDDQFNVDLQHNRTGLLSYAKSTDDTNNSQFFITEGPQRHLDFNHSIFGVLTEGESVRDAISNVATNSSNKPITPVLIETATVFNDNQNGLVLLKAPEGTSGNSTITVTATDASGNSVVRTFQVTITPDTVNGGPFLNDIPAITTPINTPVQIQLSSQDPEGNAVVYNAVKGDSQASTVTVNSTTGLVTVTPPTGYVGNLLVRAEVRAATGVANDTGDKVDSQVFTIAVTAGTPSTPDLEAASDTGSSNSDNVTNASSINVTVGGVTSGSTVKLYNGNTVVGQATASGTSVTIPVTGLSTGTLLLTATQTVNSAESGRSAGLTVNVDTTAPTFTSTAPTTAKVNSVYSSDANTNDATEGQSGFVFELVTPPSGMTINATTGAVSWTPNTAQIGSQQFAIKATDKAGNSTTQNVTVTVAQSDVVDIRLAVTDLNGNPVTSLQSGQDFQLRGFVKDLRSGGTGVYAAFLDITYAGSMAIVTGAVDHEPNYTVATGGTTSTSGLIDEIGGSSASLAPIGSAEKLLFILPMKATASGTLTFTGDPADLKPAHEVLVFGSNTAVPSSSVGYGTATVNITSLITAGNDVFNVNEDSGNVTIPVLNNDTQPSGSSGTLTVTQVGATSNGGTVSIAPNGQGVIYKPAANYNGGETFTYVVSNGTEQATGTVSVDVTSVNDAPTAVDDTIEVESDSGDNIINVLQNDSFAPDTGETLRVSAVSTSTNATISVGPNGAYVVYRPNIGFVGTDTITYTLSDGNGGTDTATVVVTVANTQDRPVAGADTTTVAEDSGATTIDVLANDSSPATPPRTPLTVSGVGTPSQGGAVTVGANGANVSYTPKANFQGTETFTYTVRDSAGITSTGTVTVTVTPVNDPPTAVNDTVTVSKDSGGVTVNVLQNDSSAPDTNETLTVTAVSTPAHGTATIVSGGTSVTYVPTAGFSGSDTFTYTISDGNGGTATASVSVQIVSFVPSILTGSSYVGYLAYSPLTARRVRAMSDVAIQLTGTDLSGTAYSTSTTTDSSGNWTLNSLPPGNFTVSQESLPFLAETTAVAGTQGGTVNDHALVLQLAEATQGTDNVFASQLPTKYLTIHDFLARRTYSNLLVAFDAANAAKWQSPGPGWDAFTAIDVQKNTTTNTLAINVTKTDSTHLAGTVAISDPRVELVEKNSTGELYRLKGTPESFNLQPVASNATSTIPAEGEGEANDALFAVDTNSVVDSAADSLAAVLTDAASDDSTSGATTSSTSSPRHSLLDFLARRSSNQSFATAVDAVMAG